MKDLLRLFTPPEWGDWNWAGKIAYAAVFLALIIPVTLFARWFSEFLFAGW